MLRLTIVLVALALAALALWRVAASVPPRMLAVHSALTNKTYAVKNMAGAQQVADRLALMELRIREFLRLAEAHAPGDPRLRNIRARWRGTLSETPTDEDVAYSLDKGDIAVCIRGPDGSVEPENTCMFILLHELAHVATDGYGHHPEFWANMKFLLELADVTGAYAYQDFDALRVSYCGRLLAASPLTCVKNASCPSALKKSLG